MIESDSAADDVSGRQPRFGVRGVRLRGRFGAGSGVALGLQASRFERRRGLGLSFEVPLLIISFLWSLLTLLG